MYGHIGRVLSKQGPYFENTIQSQADLDKFKISDPESDLAYVAEAIKISKKGLLVFIQYF